MEVPTVNAWENRERNAPGGSKKDAMEELRTRLKEAGAKQARRPLQLRLPFGEPLNSEAFQERVEGRAALVELMRELVRAARKE